MRDRWGQHAEEERASEGEVNTGSSRYVHCDSTGTVLRGRGGGKPVCVCVRLVGWFGGMS